MRLDFSCTQRLMFNPRTMSANVENNSDLESRVCRLFASAFFLVDTGFHLLAGSYKGFVWTAARILRQNPTSYYEESYSHFTKMAYCAFFILFGSLLGLIRPSIFQSEAIQEHLGWKPFPSNIPDQESQVRGVKRLTSDSEKIVHRSSFSVRNECTDSLSSDDEDFEDAVEVLSLSEVGTNPKELEKENLRLKKQLAEGFNCELFSSLKDRYSYNQILLIKKFTEKYFSSAPTIFKYTSDDVKEKINAVFLENFQRDFCEFCVSTNPNIRLASQLLTKLLDQHKFSTLINPTEATLRTVISSFL